jgi:3-phosphoshikimate 1-carboxyvinyltransferase
MQIAITPERPIRGDCRVPGDKSIAHRWLILAATADGTSAILDPPRSLDVRSTAACLAAIAPSARPSLDGWDSERGATTESNGFTWDHPSGSEQGPELEVEGKGLGGLTAPHEPLDCGNSGTTMRLLAGVLAGSRFAAVLTGDTSLQARPMERVAEPLRLMGADVRTAGGFPPIEVEGAPLRGIRYEIPIPSAQVKGAVLLAGLGAEGQTTLVERVLTRDHTERALGALGAPVSVEDGAIVLGSFQHGGFRARVPGDVSSAAFLVAAAAITGGEVTIRGVGLNPSRLRFVEVMRRMAVRIELRSTGEELGEPVGELWASGAGGLVGTTVGAEELPLVIDEVPVLAALAAHARGDSRFEGAGELRVKESDRLTGLEELVRGLGGHAAVEGDDLVLAGGGLRGGRADAHGDHRMAMAGTVAALGAGGGSWVDGIESAAVSFPGFVTALRAMGASIEG